ncbi:unnamed protein product [Rhizoctonia solani]|uniref:Uncharacterized protein n=1 Tax=Rhizoctonia solani TaxID=456999 RepID=A0A8H3E253_9AGAM|nr:unnamed protein product [Rhizoctonia solani]
MANSQCRLTIDDQILVAHCVAVSFEGNPRNLESPHRRTVELKAKKLADLLSPLNRCFVTSGYNFWRWMRAKSDYATDQVANFHDGDSDKGDDDSDEDDDTQNQSVGADNLVSTTSLRACDVTIFYTHLPNLLPTEALVGTKLLDIPLTLIELERNASRQMEPDDRIFTVEVNLTKAKKQLGQQANLVFSNHRFDRLKFVIGMAVVAEVWCYAEFWRRDQPPPTTDPKAEVKWFLPDHAWSELLYWGSNESERHVHIVIERMREVISSCGIDPVL